MKRTTDFSLHPKQCVPHFDVEEFLRNRRQLSKKNKTVFAKSVFILNFNVTVKIYKSKNKKKKTDTVVEDKIKNRTKDHTEEISVNNDNEETITDVDKDLEDMHSLATYSSDDNNSTFCEEEDANDDDAGVNKEKLPRKSTHLF